MDQHNIKINENSYLTVFDGTTVFILNKHKKPKKNKTNKKRKNTNSIKVKSSATPNKYTEGHVLSNQWFLLLFAILFSNKFSDEWVILLITCFKIKTMHFVHIHNARKLPLTILQSIDT